MHWDADIGWFLLLFALVLLACGIGHLLYVRGKQRRCTRQITGHYKGFRFGQHFEYDLDGIPYKKQYDLVRKRFYKVKPGDAVVVWLNPARPKDCYVPGFDLEVYRARGLAITVLGGLVALFGLLSVLLA